MMVRPVGRGARSGKPSAEDEHAHCLAIEPHALGNGVDRFAGGVSAHDLLVAAKAHLAALGAQLLRCSRSGR